MTINDYLIDMGLDSLLTTLDLAFFTMDEPTREKFMGLMKNVLDNYDTIGYNIRVERIGDK